MGHRVWVSEHAAQRWLERVRPSVTLKRAVIELALLLGEARVIERPGWVQDYSDTETTWLEISDGLVAACRRMPGKGTRLHAVTVLGRGGMSEDRRRRRNHRRSMRTAAARARSRNRPTERPFFGPSIDDE